MTERNYQVRVSEDGVLGTARMIGSPKLTIASASRGTILEIDCGTGNVTIGPGLSADEAGREVVEVIARELPKMFGNGWRPIETAPKCTEIPILVWTGNTYEVVTNHGFQFEDGREAWFNGDVYVQPTHWQPLPPHPTEKE